MLATTITNQVLSLKKQLVKPLADRYFQDRNIAKETNDKLLNGTPAEPINLHLEFTKVSPPTLPIEALKNLTFSAQLMPGKAFALVSMIEQSASELTQTLKARSEIIDTLHSATLRQDILIQDYYGLQRKDGNVNSMYHDIMVAISQYTNDVAFFSAELAEELQTHAAHVREKLVKLRPDTPKTTLADFSGPRKSGIMPPREDYASWLSGFTSQD